MIGILVQLALSWAIVWFYQKGNLGVLGLRPTRARVTDFALFFIVTAFCCASGFVMKMSFAGQEWRLNPELTAGLVAAGVWSSIKSVMFEELIFRGVLLYILIEKLGLVKAVILSAAAFGMYHWFSHEVIGNAAQMAVTFATTGAMGLLYAYGYAKTLSLFVPAAIHLGWNLTQGVLFSEGGLGDQVLVKVTPVPEVTVSYLVYGCIVFLPIVSALVVNFAILWGRSRTVPAVRQI